MSIGKRTYWILGLVTMIVLAFGVVALGPGTSEPVPQVILMTVLTYWFRPPSALRKR